MSSIIGEVADRDVTWQVWTDGRAYGNRPSDIVCYRGSDGCWRDNSLMHRGKEVTASAKIEEVFSSWVAKLIVSPIDPLRHLK